MGHGQDTFVPPALLFTVYRLLFAAFSSSRSRANCLNALPCGNWTIQEVMWLMGKPFHETWDMRSRIWGIENRSARSLPRWRPPRSSTDMAGCSYTA